MINNIIGSVLLIIVGLALIYCCLYIWLHMRGWRMWVFTSPRRVYWVKEGRPRDTVQGRIWRPILIELTRRGK